MFIAETLEKNRITVDSAVLNPDKKYFCPCCGGELILKNGSVVIPHFAHKSLNDCDAFSHDMSIWHKEWQEKFPLENREIPMSLEITRLDYNVAQNHYSFEKDYWKAHNEWDYLLENEKKANELITISHRTDICMNGYVIEFQHSPMSRIEFNKRNWFYQKLGYKIIWVFDLREQFNNELIECYGEWDKYNDNGAKYKWSHSFRTLDDWNPKDDKNIIVLFQFYDQDEENEFFYFERVVWAINDSEQERTNLKRFFTRYAPSDWKELMDGITDQIL